MISNGEYQKRIKSAVSSLLLIGLFLIVIGVIIAIFNLRLYWIFILIGILFIGAAILLKLTQRAVI
ncbi:MAG: hypothetical protein ACFFE5_05310 [Candidatus Thorarchaeota archaeon]